MSDDWPIVRLDSLIEHDRAICYGIVQPGSPTQGGVPIVRVGDVRDGRIAVSDPLCVSPSVEAVYSRSRLTGGELLLTLVGTVGESAIAPASLAGWNTARAIAVIPVRQEVGAYWVRLALSTPDVRQLIHSRLNTTVQATLNLGDVAQLPIVLPPAREREAIASILGALDDKIELNRRMNETLEGLARALFKSWFVDFDPVRAKAAGRQPVGMDAETARLFPDRFVESEIGHVPKGWRVGHFGEIAINPRRTARPGELSEETAYVALEHIPKRCIALSDWSDASAVESNKSHFERGSILFGKLRPYFHKVAVAPIAGVCSTDILVIEPATADWFGFALGHASSDEMIAHADRASGGTKMPRTSWNDVSRFPVALPPTELAREHTKVTRSLVAKIGANVHEARTLASLRDTLLPKLLSGELRVHGFKLEQPS